MSSGKKLAGAPKVFDIMRPGKAQPSPTSRPIIVGHKPQVQDSTLTDKPAPVADKPPVVAERKLMDANDEVSIAPIAETPAQAEVAEPPKSSEALAQPAVLPAGPETPAQPASELEQPKLPADEASVALPESIATAKPEPVADIAQPVVSFHHKPAGKRPWKWLAAIVIILVLAAVALDILLDTGTIKLSTNIPHTHFPQ
ncbi:MAG TPA: hypothetical protein VGG13_01060 [Candidatus Saccharimonadales bacterium]